MKLIELLNKIANDTLEDNTRVIIDNKLYYYNRENKSLYKDNNLKDNLYLKIYTDDLNIEVEIIDNKKETDNKVYIEEIDLRNFEIVEAICIYKINEIIRVVNNKN